MLDTKGPEIRTGFLKDHKPIQLEKDQILTLSKFFKNFHSFIIFKKQRIMILSVIQKK